MVKRSLIIVSLVLVCVAALYLVYRNQQLSTDRVRLEAELLLAQTQLEAERLALELCRERLRAEEATSRDLRRSALEMEQAKASQLAEAEGTVGEDALVHTLPPLVIPANLRESAALMGRAKIAFYEFGLRYPEGPPSMDSPEYIAYAEEFDVLMAELTPMILGMQGMGDPGEMDANSRAAFFTEVYRTSLGLDTVQSGALEQVLADAHQQVIELELRENDIPDLEENRAAWQEQRNELSEATWEQMKLHIPAEQHAVFEELYGPEYLYSMHFSLGVSPKSSND